MNFPAMRFSPLLTKMPTVTAGTFVNSGNGAAAGSTYTFSPNVAEGDVIFVTAGQPLTSMSGGSGSGGWTAATQGSLYAAWKIMQAGDVGAALSINSLSNTSPIAWTVYRGPVACTAITKKSQNSNGSNLSTVTLAGFTPHWNAKLIVAIVGDHVGGSGTIVPPTGWTRRGDRISFGWKIIGECAPADYTAADTVWTGFSATEIHNGFIFEVI